MINDRLQRMKNPDKMSETELRAVVKAWRAGLSRLARPEAFHVSRAMTNHPADIECKMRMEYAENLLEVAEL